MSYTVLTEYEQVVRYTEQISKLADQNKRAFGFLAASVYEQMALKEQLWVASDDNGELKGYLMFGGTMPRIKIFQLYVCPNTRGEGIGRILINELIDYSFARNFHTISARVASDLPANKFWEHMGFVISRQDKGSEANKRKINIRVYPLIDNDLFGNLDESKLSLTPSGPILRRDIYAIDLNLLFDVIHTREGHREVLRLIQKAFHGGLSICITPEFKRELNRNIGEHGEDTVLSLAGLFPELSSQKDTSSISETLRNIVFPTRSVTRKSAKNDESDLKHLSYCISGGINGFITREKALLRANSKIKALYNVSIISPSEIILDEDDAQSISSPKNSDFLLTKSGATSEVRLFLERFTVPKDVIDHIFSSTHIKDEINIYQAKVGEYLFGVYFFEKPVRTTSCAIACLYLDERSPKAIAAIDHFLEKTLRTKRDYTYRLNLYIGSDQLVTQETLLKKGFFKEGDCFVKIVCNLFLDRSNWNECSKDIKSLFGLTIPSELPNNKELQNTGVCVTDSNGRVTTYSQFEFETIISPGFILSPNRNCILVPIRERYANGLIGNPTGQLSLLSSHEKTLLLEKAYFRSTAKSSIFLKGGLVAFYVSGNKSIKEIIGLSRITYSDVIQIGEAIVKVERQGILTPSELAELADKNNNVHVFTFDNFLAFEHRIPFQRAKELDLISNANLVAPEEIEENKLKILIKEAFDE